MKQLLKRIPPFFKNFYFLSVAFFIIWLTLIDSNDLFLQASLSNQKTELEKLKEFYSDRIIQLKNEQAGLHTNPAFLEKIAREKYLMKKDDEELFIVIE